MLLSLLLLGCGADADGDGVASPLDCNDGDASVHPGAAEACDEVDSDCDLLSDDNDPDAARTTFYADLDDDGFGRATGTYEACAAPDGYVSDATDCDDTREDVYPGAVEVCDGLDGDCDGVADDVESDLTLTMWYLDADGDGFGDVNTAVTTCAPPDEHVADATDCDDADATTWPGADDPCGGADSDCDGADDACTRDGELGPDDADAFLIGEYAGDQAGTSIALADVDGDGVQDVLTTAPLADTVTGAAWVTLGPFDTTRDLSTSELRISGTYTDAPIENIAGGDLDGDGLAELVVATPQLPMVYTFAGTRRGALELTDADTVFAADEDSFAGLALLVGDLAADGGADLVVGASHAVGSSDGLDKGGVYVFAGPLGASLTALDSWLILEGPGAASKAGTSLAFGDLDGDGVGDLVVGAPGDSTGEAQAGGAYVLNGPLIPGMSLTEADASYLGIAAGDAAGSSVAIVGDIDGDGATDLMIGAEQADGDWTGEGAAYLLRGPLSGAGSVADAHCTLQGTAESELAGHRMVAAGDVDGDDRADVWIGSGAQLDGRAWLLQAPFAGTISLEYAEVVVTGNTLDGLGGALAAGDVDGDGRSDLLTGVPGDDSAGGAAGAVALFRGWE